MLLIVVGIEISDTDSASIVDVFRSSHIALVKAFPNSSNQSVYSCRTTGTAI